MEVNEAWKIIKESFAELAEEIVEKMERIKELFDSVDDQRNEYIEWRNQKEHMRASWFVPADTRIQSQVINNKPRNIVRKVIK
ncbi:hypothetical protein [Bacillus sp. B15-48]|uniref:hypothetical protein n=1 Tax=Bacillus sp. B15-48 TaxID=1548601 RepID=UPI00193F7EC1|nr:hypothetical protein [Bacillus sp. B15-48]MBM4762723.1 hypothetical protein [Bacillus sp. B15-48]